MYPNDDEQVDRTFHSSLGPGESSFSVTGVRSQYVTTSQPTSRSQHDTRVSRSLLRCAFFAKLSSSSKTLNLRDTQKRTHTPATAYHYNTQKAWPVACHQPIRRLHLRRRLRLPIRSSANNAMSSSLVNTGRLIVHDTYGTSTHWPRGSPISAQFQHATVNTLA
jgi:hypothetical protein